MTKAERGRLNERIAFLEQRVPKLKPRSTERAIARAELQILKTERLRVHFGTKRRAFA